MHENVALQALTVSNMPGDAIRKDPLVLELERDIDNMIRVCGRFTGWVRLSPYIGSISLSSISEARNASSPALSDPDELRIHQEKINHSTFSQARLPHVRDENDPRFTFIRDQLQMLLDSHLIKIDASNPSQRDSYSLSLVPRRVNEPYSINDSQWFHIAMADNMLLKV